MFLDMGEWTEGNLRAMYVMGSVGLLSTLAAVFLAASKIARTSQDSDEGNRKMKMLARTVSWYALFGPLDIVMHRVSEFPPIQYGLLLAAGLGLMHLTARVSLLLENEVPESYR
ncbi:MAG: hypothetical protein ACM359_10390 [Bacillota bacterium]